MDTNLLVQISLSRVQAKIYLYLIQEGQRTPTEIANAISENRTTVYSATEKLEKLGLISKIARIKADIHAKNITPSEFASYDKEEAKKYIRKTTNQDELQKATNNHSTHRLNLWFALQKTASSAGLFYNSALYCPVSRNIIPCDS